MGGGLMQLVAYGAQDIYLTGNPQITFFKVVYRRRTPTSRWKPLSRPGTGQRLEQVVPQQLFHAMVI